MKPARHAPTVHGSRGSSVAHLRESPDRLATASTGVATAGRRRPAWCVVAWHHPDGAWHLALRVPRHLLLVLLLLLLLLLLLHFLLPPALPGKVGGCGCGGRRWLHVEADTA